MVLRETKKGKNAGNQFWGCTGFPRCRKILSIS
nr:topoisomerase DNA-binding C4 zinc finger domain-containing protein [Psychromonas hadalis]